MSNLTSYEKKKHDVIKNIENFKNRIKECQEISNSANLPLDFKEHFQKLEGLTKSLEEDKVRISVLAEVSNGKSTFLNALVFKDKILDARIGETTARIYIISYGENYAIKFRNSEKKFNNLEDIKRYIQQLNKETLEKANEFKDGEKVSVVSEDELSVFIYMPLENLKHGIEVMDTPGFGTLNEDLMMKFIRNAINVSDGVIIILDISQGIKKDEAEKFSNLLKMIRPDKRYIVFNKIDAYEEEESNFDYVSENVISNMNSILKKQGYDQEIDTKKVFFISAKLALQGFINQAENKEIDKKTKEYMKYFENFETEFWKDVIDYKQKEFLSSKVSSFERTRNIINQEINNISKSLNDQLSSFKFEKDTILKEQNEINKMARILEEEAIKHIETLKGIRVDTEELINKIAEELIKKSEVLEFIEQEFGISSMLSKDKIQKGISERISRHSQPVINETIKEYYEPVFLKIRKCVEDYNTKVDEFNSKLEKLNIKKYRFPKIGHQEEKDVSGRVSTEVDIKGPGIWKALLGGYLTAGFTIALLEEIAITAIGSGLASLSGSTVLVSLAGPIGIIAGFFVGGLILAKQTKKKKKS